VDIDLAECLFRHFAGVFDFFEFCDARGFTADRAF
jgi:hypothetical protein